MVGGHHCLNEHEFEETQGDVMDRWVAEGQTQLSD